MKTFGKTTLLIGFVVMLLSFVSMPAPVESQTIKVKAGEPVKINASAGATCTYRGVSITVQGNNGFTVIAQGDPGSSSRVSCDDGTSVRIKIKEKKDDSEDDGDVVVIPDGGGGDVAPPPVIPCLDDNATISNTECDYNTNESGRIYNCTATKGVFMRPVGSVNSDPNGSIFIGNGADYNGFISTDADTDRLKKWYVTTDGRYVAASVVSAIPCNPDVTIDLSECPDLQSIADTLNQLLLEQSGFEGEALCDFIRSINDQVTLPALLSTEAQDKLTHPDCTKDPDYNAALVSFIDLMESLREYNFRIQLAVREQVERLEEVDCDFIPNLMQGQIIPNFAEENLTYVSNEDELRDVLLTAVTLSCEPFLSKDLLDKIVPSLSTDLSIDLDDFKDETDDICEIVKHLAVLGGKPFQQDKPEQSYIYYTISGSVCTPEESLGIMVQIAANVFNPDTGFDNCTRSVSDAEAQDIWTFLTPTVSPDITPTPTPVRPSFAVIKRLIVDSQCTNSSEQILLLAKLLDNQWDALDATAQHTILFTDNPCTAISIFLGTGQFPPLEPEHQPTAASDEEREGLIEATLTALPTSLASTVVPPTPTFTSSPTGTIAEPFTPSTDFLAGLDVPDDILAVAITGVGNASKLWVLRDGKWDSLLDTPDVSAVTIDKMGSQIAYLVESGPDFYEIHHANLVRDIDGVISIESTTPLIKHEVHTDDRKLTVVSNRLVFHPNGQAILFVMADEVNQQYIYQLPIDIDNGSLVYNIEELESIEPLDSINAISPDYSPDGKWILFQNIAINAETNDEEYQVIFGSSTRTGSQDDPYSLRELPFSDDCQQPTSPQFNSNTVSILVVCKYDENPNTVFERDVRDGIFAIDIGETIGEPSSLSAGPVEGFFTVFTDVGAYFVTVSNDKDANKTPEAGNTVESEDDRRVPVELTIEISDIIQMAWTQSGSTFDEGK